MAIVWLKLNKWKKSGHFALLCSYNFQINVLMHSSAKPKVPPLSVVFLCSCDKVYHKQVVRFLVYLLGQFVTSTYNPNP